MALEIRAEEKENGYVVHPSGSIDTDTYGDFEKTVTPLIDKSPKRLAIDMSKVSYVSSMGIGILIKIKKIIEDKGGVFAMTNLQPQIKKVFDVVKALPGMSIFESIEEADEYFDKVQKGKIQGIE